VFSNQQSSEKDDSQKLQIASHQLGQRLNYLSQLEKRLSHAGAAMVVFYFSYTEIIFDVLFALDDKRASSWIEFRSLHWHERFKEVLPVSVDAGLHDIYQSLLEIKRMLRDPVVHGYGCAEALLVPMPHFGLIPVSYEPFAERFRLPWIAAEKEVVHRSKDVFDRFDRWLDCDERAQFALLYAKSGFEIPFQHQRLDEIRSWMSSREEFEHALQHEAEVQDMLQEQYP
jgi:hypothetical protein